MIIAVVASILTGSIVFVASVLFARPIARSSSRASHTARCSYIVAMVYSTAPWDLHLLFEPKGGRQSVAPIGLGPESREWKHRLPPPPLTAVSAHEGGGRNLPSRNEEAVIVPDDDIPLMPVIDVGKRGWPQARIDHGMAGDERLNKFYKKHNTFSGAVVYILAERDAWSTSSASSSDPSSSSASSSIWPTEDHEVAARRRMHKDKHMTKHARVKWNQLMRTR